MKRVSRLLLCLMAAWPAAGVAAQELDAEKPLLPRITPDCRKPDPNEIVVCGERDQRSQYRLPPPPPRFDPDAGVASVSRERNALFDVGDTGIGSCSNVGPGGPFGCTFKMWKHEEQQRQGHDKKPPY